MISINACFAFGCSDWPSQKTACERSSVISGANLLYRFVVGHSLRCRTSLPRHAASYGAFKA
jgi:hypothetical protein